LADTSVVHTVYEWGRLTEGWIRDQAVPVGAFGVQVVCARSVGTPDSRVRDVASTFGRATQLRDRMTSRLTGKRWPAPYARLIDRRTAALLHAHFGDWGFGVMPVADAVKLPLVVSFYGYDAGRLARKPLWRRRFAALFARATAVLVEGPAMATRLRALGCPPERLRIMPLGVDVASWIVPTIPAGQRGGATLHLVIAASLREKKGIATALTALAEADTPRPWRLTVVGDGPLRQSLQARAADLGLADRITWSGYLPSAELRAVLSSADLLLQTSETAPDGDTEGGAPVVLLQAAAAGVPVVGTDHADIPFIVADGVTGWLAPERNASAIAEVISEVTRPERLEPAGRAARARAEERFDLPVLHRTLAALYDEATR